MNKTLTILLGVVGVLAVGALILIGGDSKAADIAFVGRGVVKSGGGTNSINVYWTQVPASVERIAGTRSDVSTSSAKKYVWEAKSGSLVKNRMTGLPTPGKEVVIRGTLHADDRVTATWVVQNYRQYKLEGKVQGVTLDTGSTDEGWVTVNVTSSVFNNLTTVRKFKETNVKGLDLRIRVNGLTKVTALGKSKHLDEVPASQQKVSVEGEVLDEDTWVSSKLNEYN